MTDNRTDRPYWCEICARKKECYGITLKPKCFVPTADRKTEPKPICESCSKNPCKKKEMINAIGHWVSECTEFDRKTEPQSLEQFRVGLEYHTDTTHFGKLKGESITTNKVEDEPQTDCSWKKGE